MTTRTSMGIETLLKGGKFIPADDAILPRLIAAVAAREKQGKTHFMLTAPDPIAIFNVDTGLEGVVHKFLHQGKTIIVYNIPKPDPLAKAIEKAAGKVWDELVEAYQQVLGVRDIRSVVFDTATEVWEILRLAFFGKLTQIMPHHYVACNTEFKKFLDMAYNSDKNLLLGQKMKAEYVNDKRTGEYEMAGFGDTPYRVQAVLNPFRVDAPMKIDDDTVLQKGDFGIKIFESRHNPAVNGEILYGEMASFPFVASMIIEGTSPDMYM